MDEERAEWYLRAAGGQRGPLTAGQVRGLVAAGEVDSMALVWREGMAGWVPVGMVFGPSGPQRRCR